MPGPPPKPAATRRRRNAVASPQRLPASSGRRAPTLPAAKDLDPSTRKWWSTVWASPMAAVYVDADVPALIRLARLVDLATRGLAGAKVLAEIRQLEDRFGLSPLARRRLQWEIDLAAGERTANAPTEPQSDRWLRVAS